MARRYPHFVRNGSVTVTIYRIVNAKRGEVFEVTWFKEGKRQRKSFRDPAQAFKRAEDTAKALDVGKGDSLALSGAELESYRLSKRILLELGHELPLHSAVQEYVAAKRLAGEEPLLAAIQKHVAAKLASGVKAIKVADVVAE